MITFKANHGQIVNPLIAMVDPVLYYSIHTFIFANLLIVNAGTTCNLQDTCN